MCVTNDREDFRPVAENLRIYKECLLGYFGAARIVFIYRIHLISPQNTTWVLIISASARRF